MPLSLINLTLLEVKNASNSTILNSFNMHQHDQLNIIYQDDDFIAVDKPSGLLSVPGLREPDNLHDRVKTVFANARVVHRLDMSTSGIVLFALHHEAQKRIGKLFEQRLMNKHYVAIINGVLTQQQGEVHSRLICDWPNRPKQKVDWQNGKHASTYYSVISRDQEKNNTRVKLKPITGRTHQLRVHMLQLGHPILGDKLYNQNDSENQYERLTLHADFLSFAHPFDSRPIIIQSKAGF